MDAPLIAVVGHVGAWPLAPPSSSAAPATPASRLLGYPSPTPAEAASVLKRRLEEAIDSAMKPHHSAPFHRGDKYFHFHNSGLQAQSVLYVQLLPLSLLEMINFGFIIADA